MCSPARKVPQDRYNSRVCGTNLVGADLTGADLTGAALNGATLSKANLNYVNLSFANLSGADLFGANLTGANLSFAILTQVHLNGTSFANADLSTTRGLVEAQHLGPSHIDLYSLKLPQDGSTLHFLRGIGVPDAWIDFYRSTTMFPIQYHSLFISYSNEDDLLARRLHTDLQDQGVRCWFAPHNMKIGDKIRMRIDEAIHLHEKVLLLLSEHAFASGWVEDEVEAAFEKERKQHREVLFPIRLDEHISQTTAAWAAKLWCTRHVGDFTQWKDPEAYQQAFEQLLRDLKKDATPSNNT